MRAIAYQQSENLSSVRPLKWILFESASSDEFLRISVGALSYFLFFCPPPRPRPRAAAARRLPQAIWRPCLEANTQTLVRLVFGTSAFFSGAEKGEPSLRAATATYPPGSFATRRCAQSGVASRGRNPLDLAPHPFPSSSRYTERKRKQSPPSRSRLLPSSFPPFSPPGSPCRCGG